jgi:hypothetical protein
MIPQKPLGKEAVVLRERTTFSFAANSSHIWEPKFYNM